MTDFLSALDAFQATVLLSRPLEPVAIPVLIARAIRAEIAKSSSDRPVTELVLGRQLSRKAKRALCHQGFKVSEHFGISEISTKTGIKPPRPCKTVISWGRPPLTNETLCRLIL